jgi:hypothetical protein
MGCKSSKVSDKNNIPQQSAALPRSRSSKELLVDAKAQNEKAISSSSTSSAAAATTTTTTTTSNNTITSTATSSTAALPL